jgi:hypothetical protein
MHPRIGFPIGHHVNLSDEKFEGPSDAYVTTVVELWENEHPTAIVKIVLSYGLFAAEVERLIDNDIVSITIAARNRADGEMCMLAIPLDCRISLSMPKS